MNKPIKDVDIVIVNIFARFASCRKLDLFKLGAFDFVGFFNRVFSLLTMY